MIHRFEKKVRDHALRTSHLPAYIILAFITVGMPMISGDKACWYVSIALASTLIGLYLIMDLYIRLSHPSRAQFYTFYVAFSELLLGFFPYWLSVNAVAFMTPYSLPVKAAHFAFASLSFWGTLWYFRYRYYPRLFEKRNGLEFGVRKHILDPDNGYFDISSSWTHYFLAEKSNSKYHRTEIERYAWVYVLASSLGIAMVHLYEFEKVQIFSFVGIAFAIISMIFAWISSRSLHDHALVRRWEKENGKLLQAK
ncbi:hypothetical protein [Nitrosomonas nitrosa]|uniref:hypothetical protein n=1 Tax=Nitrosomonas nitrosa TaxID=52442 RepID=UPI0023F81BE8|nr:hypothetical protein [Nitrosomonas nitrosa]MCO6433639.1 hypothetical protein [Nitrosomonas nitrosa]